jgi:hypothetical protein
MKVTCCFCCCWPFLESNSWHLNTKLVVRHSTIRDTYRNGCFYSNYVNYFYKILENRYISWCASSRSRSKHCFSLRMKYYSLKPSGGIVSGRLYFLTVALVSLQHCALPLHLSVCSSSYVCKKLRRNNWTQSMKTDTGEFCYDFCRYTPILVQKELP